MSRARVLVWPAPAAWTWEFTVTNASHPACDGLLLTSLAGQRSFSEGNDDATDMCACLSCWFFFPAARRAGSRVHHDASVPLVGARCVVDHGMNRDCWRTFP